MTYYPLLQRRHFLKAAAVAAGLPLTSFHAFSQLNQVQTEKRVGIIGLDTSHSVAFAKTLNAPAFGDRFKGYKVVAAYPYGSKAIQSSAERIPGYIDKIKQHNVVIVNSIQELLGLVDFVMLETNDGTLHLSQSLEVIKAGKPFFIDKPMAASLSDALAIFEAAEKANVPVFSTSSLRYMKGIDELKNEAVIGADTYSPAAIEPSHPDLFWYGIHGIETLVAAMGTGCQKVSVIHHEDVDLVMGVWPENRIGTFRGIRNAKVGYGGTVFTKSGERILGPFGGYEALLNHIIQFFETGKPPVSKEETIEVLALMEAAEESKKQGGAYVSLESVIAKARS